MKMILFIVACLSTVTVRAQSFLQTSIDNLCQEYTSRKNNHTLIIGYIVNGAEHIGVYGETEKGSGKVASPETFFGIGEISGTFTTALLVALDNQGLCYLNDPVQNYFPDSVRIPLYEKVICKKVIEETNPADRPAPPIYQCYFDATYHPKQILLCDLASHTSGLPRYPGNLHDRNDENAFRNYSVTDLYNFLNKYQPESATGMCYIHSPLGIAMIGNGVSWKSTISYDSLLRLHVLSPLSLHNTFTESDEALLSSVIPGHDNKGARAPLKYNIFVPAMGLYSNVYDMMNLVKAHLQPESTPLQNALLDMQNARIAVTGNKKLKGAYATMGWIISPVMKPGATPIIWQHGNSGGYAAYVGYNTESKTGVVILSNSMNSVDETGVKILQLLYENSDRPKVNN